MAVTNQQLGIKVNAKERLFAHEYLIDRNPERAALAAGYSPSVANKQSYSWISNPKRKPSLKQYIEKLLTARDARISVDADWILQEQKRLYNTSIADFITIDEKTGRPYFDITNATPQQLACIESMEFEVVREDIIIKEGEIIGRQFIGKVKIKLTSKRAILMDMAKHVSVNALANTQVLTGPDNGPIQVEEVSPEYSKREIARRLAYLIAKGEEP